MAGFVTTTIVGNLTTDPELSYTPGGAAVCNFTIAETPRSKDKESGEWKDGVTLFMRCTAWARLAENIAQSLHKGDSVIAVGKLQQRQYTNRDGNEVTVIELVTEYVGASMEFATVTAKRVTVSRKRDEDEDDDVEAPRQAKSSAPAGNRRTSNARRNEDVDAF